MTNLKAHKSADRQVCKVAEKRVRTRHEASSRMHTATKVDLRQVGWDQKPDERFCWSSKARTRRWLARAEFDA